MWRAGAAALWSHWRRHPGQALTLVLGLALATALWTGVQAINAEARASYARASDVVLQNNRPTLVARDGGAIPLTRYAALRRAGWQVAPVLEGTARLGGRQVTLLGLDPLSSPVLPTGSGSTGDTGGLTAFIGPPGQLYAAKGTAARLTGTDLPEILISDDLPSDTLIGDIALVARLLGRPDSLSRLVLAPDQPANLPPLAQIAPDLIRATASTDSDIGGLTDSFHLNLTAFGLLSFTVGLFIVHGAVGLAFEQRRAMVRTLRALGLPARSLIALLTAELVAVALLSGLIGVALGYLIAAALLPGVAATLSGLYGAPASDSLSLRPGWVAAGLGMALLGTAIAGAQSLWHLSRLPILASAAPRAWSRASQTALRWQGLLALALLVASAAIGASASSLTAGFATLATLLLGAALALPPVLSASLALGERCARGPLTQWFWADSRQQLPGLSLALMALLLALSANIGVSTMVGSFRITFTGWIDQRLAAEVYVDAGSPATAQTMLPFLRTHSTAVLPRMFAEAHLTGLPGEVQGLTDDATYRDNWPLLTPALGVWDALATGPGVLINEQLAYRAGLHPGDDLDLDGAALPILAIYSDYGNPRPQAILGMDAFTVRYPDQSFQRFGLRLPTGDVSALRRDLQQRFGLRPDQIVDQASLKAVSLRIFEQTFAVTAALNILTLTVAALAILTSLLTLATLRLPQIAPVWALGLTRARLGQLELLRAGTLALFTAVLAIPTGLLLAWVLLALVNTAAFGWRLPMQVFPGDWAILTGLALIAALLAAAWPARRLATRPPADLLKVFASER